MVLSPVLKFGAVRGEGISFPFPCDAQLQRRLGGEAGDKTGYSLQGPFLQLVMFLQVCVFWPAV